MRFAFSQPARPAAAQPPGEFFFFSFFRRLPGTAGIAVLSGRTLALAAPRATFSPGG